jgi:hypothetical protein
LASAAQTASFSFRFLPVQRYRPLPRRAVVLELSDPHETILKEVGDVTSVLLSLWSTMVVKIRGVDVLPEMAFLHVIDVRDSNIVAGGDTLCAIHVLELRMCHRGLRRLGDAALALARVERVEDDSSPASASVADEGVESSVIVETCVGARVDGGYDKAHERVGGSYRYGR